MLHTAQTGETCRHERGGERGLHSLSPMLAEYDTISYDPLISPWTTGRPINDREHSPAAANKPNAHNLSLPAGQQPARGKPSLEPGTSIIEPRGIRLKTVLLSFPQKLYGTKIILEH